MENKYNLRLNENVFLAKEKLVESVYCSAKVEGLNTTFPETQTILDGVNIPNATIDDITTILNLRDAWRFVLASIQDAVNLDYICGINALVGRNESLGWGVLRKGNVGISGTDFVPEIPVKGIVSQNLQKILDAENTDTRKAIDMFLYIVRNQLFWDGNKRTATLAANKILIMNGAGILQIKDDSVLEFNVCLKKFYDGGADGYGVAIFIIGGRQENFNRLRTYAGQTQRVLRIEQKFQVLQNLQNLELKTLKEKNYPNWTTLQKSKQNNR